jgi:hypothetical protein
MTTLDALYFPDTVLLTQQFFPFTLFLKAIHLLQPVEADEKKGIDAPTLSGSHPFMESEFCQVHTPSRLGVDRERFLHLLNDIRNRKDSFVEQLHYLSLAALSAPDHHSESSKQTIISSLLHGIDQENEHRDEQNRLALWQARLVLKIAEFLDQEEDELARQLASIDDKEIALFRSLQGEMNEAGEEDEDYEDPFTEVLELRQKLHQPRPGMIKNRLRAWIRLYLSGPAPKEFPLWITSRQEAADILLEQYETECGCLPIRFLRIKLPSPYNGSENEIKDTLLTFREASQAQRKELSDIFDILIEEKTIADTLPTHLLSRIALWEEEWDSKFRNFFPDNHRGRTGLTFYLLPGMSLASLISKMNGVQTTMPFSNGLLAVVCES